MSAAETGQELDLHGLAKAARAASDRLLWARRLRASADDADPPANPVIVTPAPLHESGADGPLFGVPVTVKDSYETAGLRSTAGHPPLADHTPAKDAALVARLRATGSVLMGKTNLAELCADIQTDNPLFGRTHNPWDASRTAGGSSGGGAVAVALGQSRLDLASDLAGSVRIPAGYCGVAALKASAERLPMAGHIPPLPDHPAPASPFLAAGLIARDATDLAQAWAALVQEDEVSLPEQDLKLGWATDFGLPLSPANKAGLDLAQDWFSTAGCAITARNLPYRLAWQAYGVLLTSAAAAHVPTWQKLGLRLLAASAPSRPLRAAMLRGLAGASTARAEALRVQVTQAVDAALEGVDALLCPLATTLAFPHAPKPRSAFAVRRVQSGEHRLPYTEATIGITCMFSLTGHPVVILPVTLIDGLPFSVQLIGAMNQEAKLLAVARRLESILAARRPPLWRQLADKHPQYPQSPPNPP